MWPKTSPRMLKRFCRQESGTDILVAIILGFLPDRVRRIADDDAIGAAFCRLTRWLFSGKAVFDDFAAGFVELERVGQHDPFEGNVFRLSFLARLCGAVEGLLDVDGGDVVGEQDDLVGVQLVLVFAQQVLPAG